MYVYIYVCMYIYIYWTVGYMRNQKHFGKYDKWYFEVASFQSNPASNYVHLGSNKMVYQFGIVTSQREVVIKLTQIYGTNYRSINIIKFQNIVINITTNII